MNNIILAGRLTAEPILRSTQSGHSVLQFDIAVTKRFKREGGPTADFFRCNAWDKTGDTIYRYLHQGDGIVVRGRIENDNYTDRNGNKVYSMVVIVEDWDFGPKKRGTEGNYNNQSQNYGGQGNYGGQQMQQGGDRYADGFMNIPDGIDEELPFN